MLFRTAGKIIIRLSYKTPCKNATKFKWTGDKAVKQNNFCITVMLSKPYITLYRWTLEIIIDYLLTSKHMKMEEQLQKKRLIDTWAQSAVISTAKVLSLKCVVFSSSMHLVYLYTERNFPIWSTLNILTILLFLLQTKSTIQYHHLPNFSNLKLCNPKDGPWI